MLCCYHGASTLGRLLRRRRIMTSMASYVGTSSLATDAMRSIVTLLGRASSTRARPPSPSQSRVWNPNHGIVFGNNALSTAPNAPRSACMNSPTSISATLATHSSFEDPYALVEAFQTESSDSQASTATVLSISDHADDGDWAPSTASASQISETHEIAERQDVREGISKKSEVSEEIEFHIPLSFTMSKEVLKKAQEATPGSKESFWSHKMYLGPENQEVKVHYCRTKHTTERVAEYFVDRKVLGFDIEWKAEATKTAGIKKNVALIQIASEDRIGLFHIALYPGETVDSLVAPTLKKIMEDPEITKVGVAIKADCTRLRNYLQIDPKGIFELSHLYKLVKYSGSGDVDKINKKLVSVATQVQEHLHLPIFKGEVRGSDWSQALSMEQIMYAASDSYANLMLYDTLEGKRTQLDPTPPRPYHAELNLPIRLATGGEIPTADEAIEDPDPSTTTEFTTATSTIYPVSALEAAAENIQIESDEDSDLTYDHLPKSKAKAKPKEVKDATTQPPKSQRVIEAEAWATAHRETHPVSKTSRMPSPTFAALKVYALWHHNPDMSLPEIAAALRDPPLKSSTLANYILEVVRVEKVPFEKERIVKVFEAWPEGSKAWRYKTLREKVEVVE